eukprot:4311259-Lingulodinium_polyedra.AAC.1
MSAAGLGKTVSVCTLALRCSAASWHAACVPPSPFRATLFVDCRRLCGYESWAGLRTELRHAWGTRRPAPGCRLPQASPRLSPTL